MTTNKVIVDNENMPGDWQKSLKLNRRSLVFSSLVLVILGASLALIVNQFQKSQDIRGQAAGRKASDIETFRGQVDINTPATVNFTTFSNETQVILTLQAGRGGDKKVDIFDNNNTFVGGFSVPSGVTSGWSTSIGLNPNTNYKAVISINSDRSKYTFYVNHCPNGQCF